MISLPEYPYPLSIALVSIVLLWTVLGKKKSKDSIPTVPYNLPWIGSGFDIARNGIGGWVRKNVHYGPVFRAYISGCSVVFVTDPVAARQVLNSRETDITSVFHESFGKTSVSMRSRDAELFLPSMGAMHAAMENHFSVDKLGDMLFHAQQQIKQMIPSEKKILKCGLYEFISKIIYRVTVSQLVDIPELETDRFYHGMRLYLFNIRRFIFMRIDLQKYFYFRAFRAREAFVSQIKGHLIKTDLNESTADSPACKTSGQLGRYADAIFKKKGVSVDGRARLMLLDIWVALVNTLPTAFSLVFHLLENPIAKEAVLDEVRKIAQLSVANSSTVTFAGFSQDDLNKMVKLDSVLNETLRFDTTRDVVRHREVVKDCNLKLTLADGKKVEFSVDRGSKIATCPVITNRDEEVFLNAEEFVWDRFVPRQDGHKPVEFFKSGKLLPYPFDAFANGPFYCPGRNFARIIIKAVVANLLLECDVRFAAASSRNSHAIHEAQTISWFKPLAPDMDVEIELRHY
jgi:hypothetical protein